MGRPFRRKVLKGEDGQQKTHTYSSNGVTFSQSVGNENTRQTFTKTPDGKLKSTTTRHLGNGWTQKDVKTIGSSTKKKPKGKRNTFEDQLFQQLIFSKWFWIILLVLIVVAMF